VTTPPDPADRGAVVTRTRVISVKGKSALEREALQADPAFVYVGRGSRPGWKTSEWRNPYRTGNAKEDVREFKRWLRRSKEGQALLARVHELRGKTLGCWCVDWDGTGEPAGACHAVVLARLADGYDLGDRGA
jgi:hypothetical protein